MLVNVVQSGSLPLVGYLLSINELDINDDSNAPIKVVYQAIYSRDEQFTLFVLGNEIIYSVTVYYINYDVGYCISVPECINAAYTSKIFSIVCVGLRILRARKNRQGLIWSHSPNWVCYKGLII